MHVHPVKIRMQSDQSLQGTLWVIKDSKHLQVDNEDYNQTVLMRRVIWVFARQTCNLVGNTVPQLILYKGDRWIDAFRDLSPFFKRKQTCRQAYPFKKRKKKIKILSTVDKIWIFFLFFFPEKTSLKFIYESPANQANYSHEM